jgi:MFS family permease
MLGPLAGGFIVEYFPWRVIFFVNLPIGFLGLYLVYRYLPGLFSEKTDPLDFVGLVLFGSGIALFSYVLEIFGEHTLSSTEIVGLLVLSLLLLLAYWRHSLTIEHPLLRLRLFLIRTFRSSVAGGLVTRLGIGGMPFLLPLLYQVGLGYGPLQSGMLMMPQPLAAMSLKMTMPWVITRFGYRRVLVSNTIFMGLLIALFATIGPATPVWLIGLQAFCFGYFSSLQFTAINTIVYADLTDKRRQHGQQHREHHAAAVAQLRGGDASLVAAYFIPDRFHASAGEMISGIHRALVVVGVLTLFSALVFRQLRPEDGANVSRHRVEA